jgi:hypothetical protein
LDITVNDLLGSRGGSALDRWLPPSPLPAAEHHVSRGQKIDKLVESASMQQALCLFAMLI